MTRNTISDRAEGLRVQGRTLWKLSSAKAIQRWFGSDASREDWLRGADSSRASEEYSRLNAACRSNCLSL